MAIPTAEYAVIKARYQAAYRAIRRWNLEHRAPELSRSYAIPADDADLPTYKDIRRCADAKAAWKAQGGSVLQGTGRACYVCGDPARPKRVRCAKCDSKLQRMRLKQRRGW